MAIDNDFNLSQYNTHAEAYLSTNTDQHIGGGDTESRIMFLRDYLRVGSKVFEIGAGGGEDAMALLEAGYKVTASDFSEKFVEIMRTKGLPATQFDAKKDKLPDMYDAIYANAAFVHFTPTELKDFLQNAHEALKGPKLIFLSVINGSSQERRTGSTVAFERDFQDYSVTMLEQILTETGFTNHYIELVDEKWLQVIANAQ